MYRRMGGVLKKKLRLAAEQPWMVTLGASPGNLAGEPGKLRSSDVDSIAVLHSCSAASRIVLRFQNITYERMSSVSHPRRVVDWL